MSGRVKFYNAKRGYGVIALKDSEVIFLRKDIFKPHQHCTYNEIVIFDLVKDNLGVRAVNIRQVV